MVLPGVARTVGRTAAPGPALFAEGLTECGDLGGGFGHHRLSFRLIQAEALGRSQILQDDFETGDVIGVRGHQNRNGYDIGQIRRTLLRSGKVALVADRLRHGL